jgi:RHS repeat-associated protein
MTMNGASPIFGFWPGPGGTAVINGTFGGGGWLHKDWLGSARIVSDVSNHTVTLDQAYTPYGEIYLSFGNNSGQYQMFAGMQGLFAFDTMSDTPNRELSTIGRWLSPDPAGAGWNQYAYTTNPNRNTDPSGLIPYSYAPPADLGGDNEFGYLELELAAANDSAGGGASSPQDCSRGCVTSVAVNTLTVNGQTTLVGTVPAGPDFDNTLDDVAAGIGLYSQTGFGSESIPPLLLFPQVRFGVSGAIQTGAVQVDTNSQVSTIMPPTTGFSGTLSVDGPSDDQNVLAEPSLGVGKFVSIGTDLVMDSSGNLFFQGFFVSLGASWPPTPATLTMPLNYVDAPANGLPPPLWQLGAPVVY